ncbi:MAG: hypothetical protein K2K69_03310, partial [Muribaculaceae bacterium]|nr:hypothetical protein [Muribaculaceae bacterium]
VYKGLVTGVRDYTASSAGLTTVNIYNAEGFVTAVNSRMLNGRQMRTFTYDRRGKVLSEREEFTQNSGKTYVRVTSNTYDNAERLISSIVVENGKTAKIERSYGKNGLLSRENFGNGLHRSYTYDIHGWLASSNLSSLNTISPTSVDLKSEEYYSPLAVGGAIVKPGINVVNLTEQLLYTEGATPLYSGCPSAKVMISGGRYDYTFDDHRRLIRADYTASGSGDYSTEYTYDDVANPLTVKRKGIVNTNSIGTATFGLLDDLTYTYNGNQVQHIRQGGTGMDFYGRTGYALAHGDYTWNAAGLLNSDSSRGIVSTTYNHLGLPVSQVVPSGLTSSTGQQPTKTVNYAYSADGVLLAINNSGVMRHYSGSRIFQNNALEYSYFPGGYFDASGNPHYTHADYQGSIIAVTDSTGRVVQTTNYYPYGEPWCEPTGQPMLFSGKERTSLADYLYGPRKQISAIGLWDAPDIKAHNFTRWSPYTYCGSNPIGNIDPTGKVVHFIPAIIGGALIGGFIDVGVQVSVNMCIKNNSFIDALKQVDLVSVGKSAILGALTGPFASLSKVSTTVNTVKNMKSAMPVIESALEVADAAVDYSYEDGLSVVECGENPKEWTDALLDIGGAAASKVIPNSAVNWTRTEATKEIQSSVFHTYTKEEKEFAKKVQKATESDVYETSITLWSNFGINGVVENNKKNK